MWLILLAAWIVSGCASARPTAVSDLDSELYVASLARQILAVTEDATNTDRYRFYVTAFGREGLAGLSVGDRVVYIDIELVRRSRAAVPDGIPTELAMVIAHEIGHDISGHAPKQEALQSIATALNLTGRGIAYLPGVVGLIGSGVSWLGTGISYASGYLYGRAQELEADRRAIGYWKALGWRCDEWVTRFQGLADRGITGDFRHPTEGRLEQAKELCGDDGAFGKSTISVPQVNVTSPRLTTPDSRPACPAGEFRSSLDAQCKSIRGDAAPQPTR